MDYFLEDGIFYSSQRLVHHWGSAWSFKPCDYLDFCCMHIVRPYLPVAGRPRLYIDGQERARLMRHWLGLPSYVTGITLKSDIHLFVEPDGNQWMRVLRHEVVHANIWLLFQSDSHVPKWINEGLAYGLGRDHQNNYAGSTRYTESDSRILFQKVEADDFDLRDRFDNAIIRSLGLFIIQYFAPHEIKSFFIKLLQNSDKMAAFHDAFDLPLEKFVKHWIIWSQKQGSNLKGENIQ